MVYQSHIYKIRILKPEVIEPEILFLLLNSSIVQKQIRAIQFTADIIDTIGQRVLDVVLPIPKSKEQRAVLVERTKKALAARVAGKVFIKYSPELIEACLLKGSEQPIKDFMSLSLEEMVATTSSQTVTSEFGEFESFWKSSNEIRRSIFLPKYYDPSVKEELDKLSENCYIPHIRKLEKDSILEYYIGDEIGKMAYGTGEIPFIRTSDFSNWEIKHDPKQGISEDIYAQYCEKQDTQTSDLFLVRDGTYLVGSSCIVTEYDAKSLFCGGLYKIRVKESKLLTPFLLLALINSFVVKRQFRTKQFTRDVIDTMGARIREVFVPIPKSKKLRREISQAVADVIKSRIESREEITTLTREILE